MFNIESKVLLILCSILISLLIFGVVSGIFFTKDGSSGGFIKSLVIPEKGSLIIFAVLTLAEDVFSPEETFDIFSFTLNLPLVCNFLTLLSSSLRSSSSSGGI